MTKYLVLFYAIVYLNNELINSLIQHHSMVSTNSFKI